MTAPTLLAARAEHDTHHATYTRPNHSTPGHARAGLAHYLARHGHGGDNALLVLSELATNAVRYATGPLTITARIEHDTLTLTVTDHIDPHPHHCGLPDDEHGLGLTLVRALCTELHETTDHAAGRHAVTAAIPLDQPAI